MSLRVWDWHMWYTMNNCPTLRSYHLSCPLFCLARFFTVKSTPKKLRINMLLSIKIVGLTQRRSRGLCHKASLGHERRVLEAPFLHERDPRVSRVSHYNNTTVLCSSLNTPTLCSKCIQGMPNSILYISIEYRTPTLYT